MQNESTQAARIAPTELPDPVADQFGRLHPTGGPHAQAYGRIDVAAGDGPNAVSRANERKAKGECDADDADLVAGDHGSTAPKKHQDEGADQFCKVFLHILLLAWLDFRRDEAESDAVSR